MLSISGPSLKNCRLVELNNFLDQSKALADDKVNVTKMKVSIVYRVRKIAEKRRK